VCTQQKKNILKRLLRVFSHHKLTVVDLIVRISYVFRGNIAEIILSKAGKTSQSQWQSPQGDEGGEDEGGEGKKKKAKKKSKKVKIEDTAPHEVGSGALPISNLLPWLDNPEIGAGLTRYEPGLFTLCGKCSYCRRGYYLRENVNEMSVTIS
jgi:hypothetical protein